METLWILPAIAGYALAAALFIGARLGGRMRAGGWAVTFLAIGAIFQALDLVSRGIQAGNMPVTNFATALSFMAWLTALAGLVLIVRRQMSVIGAYIAPAVAVTFTISEMMLTRGPIRLPAQLNSVWLPIHVTLAIFGYSLFVLAASVSLVYLAYESRLKAKRPLPCEGERMPSLEKLDRINYHLLGWGFLMLSLAMVSGAIWSDSIRGHFWSWEPVESWSLALWIMYAALLESRVTVGWRGRRAAALTVAVFVILLGSFVGMMMHPGKHGGSFG